MQSPEQEESFHLAAHDEPEAAPSQGHLSRAVQKLADEAEKGHLTLGQAVEHLQENAPLLMCALLSLPFCQPIPLLGVSIPFGLSIAFLSLSLLITNHARLPKRLGRVRIPAHFFPTLLNVTGWLLAKIERITRIRLAWLTRRPWKQVAALIIAINAVLLMLPLPIPFSNTFPAATILALSVGLLEEDGLAVLLGFIMALATVVFFSVIVLGAGAIGHAAAD